MSVCLFYLFISFCFPKQVESVYESLGVIISAQTDPSIREALVSKLFEIQNIKWSPVLASRTNIGMFLCLLCLLAVSSYCFLIFSLKLFEIQIIKKNGVFVFFLLGRFVSCILSFSFAQMF
jgi:hypothetical protein